MSNYYYTEAYMKQFFKMHRPFNQGKINTKDGQVIAFSEYGNSQGNPILHIHGGPGGRSQPIDLAFFDLSKQRVILYDQRHCGFSKSDRPWQENNTTELLIEDLELLRSHLRIDTWSLFGGSWGSCLGLCYSIKFPQRVNTQVYWGVLLGTKNCTDFVPANSLSPMEKFYCDNNFFLEENFIISNIHQIKDKAIKIAHGNADPVCSIQNAITLKEKLPQIELFIATGESHHPYMPQMFKVLTSFVKDL